VAGSRTAAEVLLVMKTRRDRLAALERLLLRRHPYDTPEVVALALQAGTARYLAWLGESTRG
jgi:periplasmic divalent cation tolerance protein